MQLIFMISASMNPNVVQPRYFVNPSGITPFSLPQYLSAANGELLSMIHEQI